MEQLNCSIGVFAHNEAGNIADLLKAILGQKTTYANITEIIVVSSASTDGTDDIVRDVAAVNPQVKLITQARREGKSAAINLFLSEASEAIAIIISGDVIPAESTIEKLVSAFKDSRVGACGGRPMPVNPHDSFIGFAVHMLWRMHHRMALISPKLGEMIAFRRVMESIPADSAVDEASIEAIIRAQGMELRYIPDAIIHNKGPENMSDFVKQRRRIQNGHLWLMDKQGYQVVSQNKGTLLKILMQELSAAPSDVLKILGVMLLEAYCRALGSWDYRIKKKNPFTWEIARSTKNLK